MDYGNIGFDIQRSIRKLKKAPYEWEGYIDKYKNGIKKIPEKAADFADPAIDHLRLNNNKIEYRTGESPVDFINQNLKPIWDNPKFKDGVSFESLKDINIHPGKSITTPDISSNKIKISVPDEPSAYERAISPNYDVFENPMESKIRDLIYKAHESYEANKMLEYNPKKFIENQQNYFFKKMSGHDDPADSMMASIDFDGKNISTHLSMDVLAQEAALLNDLLTKYPNDPNVIKAVEGLYSYRNKDGEYDVLSGVARHDIGDINSKSLPEILKKIRERESQPGGRVYDYDKEVIDNDFLVKDPVFTADRLDLDDLATKTFLKNPENNNKSEFFGDLLDSVKNYFNENTEKIKENKMGFKERYF